MMKKKMMSAGGNMKKKGYAAGGMPMAKDPKTGKMMPSFAMDGVGKMAKGGSAMYKKGYAAGGVAMKKKMMAGGGMPTKKKLMAASGTYVSSDYDISNRKMPGSVKSTKNISPTNTAKKKAPIVTKDRLNKLGMTLREFRNAYEINKAGTGYTKRSKALKPRSSGKKTNVFRNIGRSTGKNETLAQYQARIKKETAANLAARKKRLNKNKKVEIKTNKNTTKKKPVNFNIYR